MTGKNFKVNDRVVRAGGDRSKGVVREVREESTASAAEAIKDREKLLIIEVLWDNGTLSFFGPAGLEHARE